TFAYRNLALSSTTLTPDGRLQVTADVTNTGGMAGDTVVQLYVGARGSRLERARRGLRDFARVSLEPGETRPGACGVAAAEPAQWDPSRGGWVVEPIGYEVWVGSSARDLPLRATVVVVLPSPPPRPLPHAQASSAGPRRCSRSTASRYSCTRS